MHYLCTQKRNRKLSSYPPLNLEKMAGDPGHFLLGVEEDMSWLKYCILVLLISIGLTGCQSAAKPPTKDLATKQGMPALNFADRYAGYIAGYQYDKASAVSSEQNRKLIESEIKPFMQNLAAANRKNQILFKDVQFLSAYLIGGDERHLLVLEALVPLTSLVNGERVMLHYEIQPQGQGFEVVSSHIRLDSDSAP